MYFSDPHVIISSLGHSTLISDIEKKKTDGKEKKAKGLENRLHFASYEYFESNK